MNDAHLHLAINHFPVILPVIGLLVMLAGLIFRSEIVKRAACSLFIAGAIVTLPASRTGEGAEEIAEKLQGVEEKFIEEHEESAETFAVLSYILGGISIVALWASVKQRSFSRAASIVAMAFSAVVVYFAMTTANSGGEIRHPEIRSGFVAPAAGDGEADHSEAEHED